MKFIYSMNLEVSQSLIDKGLKKIGETTINGEKADIFQNDKNIYLGKYEKNTLILMNRLLF